MVRNQKEWRIYNEKIIKILVELQEIGLPATLREFCQVERSQLRMVADSCNISAGSYKRLTHDEIYEILEECYETNGGN